MIQNIPGTGPVRPQPSARRQAASPADPGDNDPPGAIRSACDKAAQYVGGAVGAALSVPSGALMGAALGVTHITGDQPTAEDMAHLHLAFQAGTDVVATLVGAGNAGSLLTGAATLAAGGGATYLHNSLANSTRVCEKIRAKVGQGLAKVPHSDSAIRDGFRAVTVGTLYGAVAGAGPASEIAGKQAVGLTEGIFEGAHRGAQALAGQYDLPFQAPPEGDSGWARKATYAVFGTAGAVLGSTFSSIDGAIQGGLVAALKPEYEADADIHRTLIKTQAGLASVVGLGMALGPLGVVGGLVAGGYLAHAIGRIEEKSGIDKAITKNVQNAVESSLNQTQDLGDENANRFRDTVAGTMVGAAAGARSGARFGFQGGKGAAEGVIQVATGVADAVEGVYEALKEVLTGHSK